MAKQADEVLGTFTICDVDGKNLSGYITNMFDVNGEDVFDPREAEQFVGYCQEGSAAGKCLRWSAAPEDELCRLKIQ